MILVDTSVWVEHLRRGDLRLANLLQAEQVCCHPFVIGELALGYLKNRAEILALLTDLPELRPASQEEVLAFIEEHEIGGTGLGWVDVHLLCAAARDRQPLWTLDRRLAEFAGKLGVQG